MKSIEEIIASVKDVKYIGASGPILDICRELARDGRFSEIGNLLTDWFKFAPQSELFLRSRLPAIILNSYIVHKDILSFEQFMKWENSNEWAEQIIESSLQGSELQTVINNILESMINFAKKSYLKDKTMYKRERFLIFLRELAAAPPAFSRESALSLVNQTMNKVEDEYSNHPWGNFTDRMHVYGFEPEYNWKDLDKDPCHWTDSAAKTHRIALYDNGRIQIYSLRQDSQTAILDKNGV